MCARRENEEAIARLELKEKDYGNLQRQTEQELSQVLISAHFPKFPHRVIHHYLWLQ